MFLPPRSGSAFPGACPVPGAGRGLMGLPRGPAPSRGVEAPQTLGAPREESFREEVG